jgi:hypothetical protein
MAKIGLSLQERDEELKEMRMLFEKTFNEFEDESDYKEGISCIDQTIKDNQKLPKDQKRDRINRFRLWMDENWDNFDEDQKLRQLGKYEGLVDDYRAKYDPDFVDMI